MPYAIETHDKPDHDWLGLQERPAPLDSLRMAYLYRKCYL